MAEEHRGQKIYRNQHDLQWWATSTQYDLDTRAKNYACTKFGYNFDAAGWHRRKWSATFDHSEIQQTTVNVTDFHVTSMETEDYLRMEAEDEVTSDTMRKVSLQVQGEFPRFEELNTTSNSRSHGRRVLEKKRTERLTLQPGYKLVRLTTVIHGRQCYYLVSDGTNVHRDLLIYVPFSVTVQRHHTVPI